MRALAERKSTREFSAEKLPPQVLSNLLWAAYGVNRPDGRRTAPSAMNEQTVDIYVTLPEGVYLYQAREHRLNLVAPGDFRAAAGQQVLRRRRRFEPGLRSRHRQTRLRFRPTTNCSTPAPKPASSARMSTCFARRRAWPQSSAR